MSTKERLSLIPAAHELELWLRWVEALDSLTTHPLNEPPYELLDLMRFPLFGVSLSNVLTLSERWRQKRVLSCDEVIQTLSKKRTSSGLLAQTTPLLMQEKLTAATKVVRQHAQDTSAFDLLVAVLGELSQKHAIRRGTARLSRVVGCARALLLERLAPEQAARTFAAGTGEQDVVSQDAPMLSLVQIPSCVQTSPPAPLTSRAPIALSTPAPIQLDAAQLRGGTNACLSATQLESLVACPAQWFVMRRLLLQSCSAERTPSDAGTLAHKVLERFVTADIEASIPAREHWKSPQLAEDLDETLRAWLREAPAKDKQLLDRFNAERPSEQHEWRTLTHVLVNSLRTEAEQCSGFVPRWCEWAFGTRKKDAPATVYAGVPVIGTVDRIDVNESGHALIFDYKNKEADELFDLEHWATPKTLAKLKAGEASSLPLHFQVLMYAQVVRRAHPELIIDGAYYITLKDGSYQGISEEQLHNMGAPMSFYELLDAVEALVSQRITPFLHGVLEKKPTSSVCAQCMVRGCAARVSACTFADTYKLQRADELVEALLNWLDCPQATVRGLYPLLASLEPAPTQAALLDLVSVECADDIRKRNLWAGMVALKETPEKAASVFYEQLHILMDALKDVGRLETSVILQRLIEKLFPMHAHTAALHELLMWIHTELDSNYLGIHKICEAVATRNRTSL